MKSPGSSRSPATGATIIFVSAADWVFDFHGYSRRQVFLAHVWKRSRALWPGWDATLVAFPLDLLVNEAKSRAFGLWLAEPSQFLHDPLPRARRYLDRFPAPDDIGSVSAELFFFMSFRPARS